MEPKGSRTIEHLPEFRRIPLPRTPVNKDRERIRRKAARFRPPEIERWT